MAERANMSKKREHFNKYAGNAQNQDDKYIPPWKRRKTYGNAAPYPLNRSSDPGKLRDRSTRDRSRQFRESSQRRSSSFNTEFVINADQIKMLMGTDAENIITTLSNNTQFKTLLNRNNIDDCTIVMIIQLLLKVCQSPFKELKTGIIVVVMQSHYVDKLLLFVISIPMKPREQLQFLWDNWDQFWIGFMQLCKTVHEGIPAYFDKVKQMLTTLEHATPAIEEKHETIISPEAKNTMNQLLTLQMNVAQGEITKIKANDGDDVRPPDNFRQIEIEPNLTEILERKQPFLRNNIIDGPFRSAEQYLDIHFRLLREDFVAPLRNGIQIYMENATKPRSEWSKLENIRIYRDVKFIKRETQNEFYCYRIAFSTKRGDGLHLENSKTLIYGSLVCFTSDSFKSLLCGTVVNRDKDILNLNCIIVGFREPVQIDDNASYLMVESGVYFEPYARVLNALKKIPLENYRMAKFILYLQTDVGPPLYRKSDVCKDEELLNIRDEEWPGELNPSQMNAFKAALSEELCIIQGPPGTGKTYLGLKIVDTLLMYKKLWHKDSPILVVCYTNHALDQFLEGILSMTDQILRIGGQSKSTKLARYNLSRVTDIRDSSIYRNVHNMKLGINNIDESIKNIQSNHYIVNFSNFENLINNYNDSWWKTATSYDIIKWLAEPALYRKSTAIQKVDISRNDFLEEINFNTKFIPLKFWHSGYTSVPERYLNKVHDYIKAQLSRRIPGSHRNPPRNVNIVNPYRMDPNSRWQFYLYLLDRLIEELSKKHSVETAKYCQAYGGLEEYRLLNSINQMRQMLVVGMTTTSAARLQNTLQVLQPPIVIVEEAAEVLESHVVTALTENCQHLILIGDHKQLQPSTANYRVATKYKLGISLFERLVKNGINCHTLNVQHRMRPEISSLIKPNIYQVLEDHQSTLNRGSIAGISKPLYFIDHHYPETTFDNTSKRNDHEVTFLLALARHLVLNGYGATQITILAAYLGQMYQFQKERKAPQNSPYLNELTIAVLDNYQGEENDIILLSLVRNNDENRAGFLKNQNRVCVALSRARNGLYIMGNMDLLVHSNSENQIWKNVHEKLKKQDAIGESLPLRCKNHRSEIIYVKTAADFQRISEGGCERACESMLICGHTCKMVCHVQNRYHTNFTCTEICDKSLCGNYDHKCKKLCRIPCGPCTYTVLHHLKCGHDAEIMCSRAVATYKCVVKEEVLLPCNHKVVKLCWIAIDDQKCNVPCEDRLDCGHTCRRKCHIISDPNHEKYQCRGPCILANKGCQAEDKHMCIKLCSQKCDECSVLVSRIRSCGHKNLIRCSENIESTRCEKSCKKILECGHRCKGVCSEKCPPCLVKVKKEIPNCHHHKRMECFQIPTKKDCINQTCPLILPCGHQCQETCNRECTEQCQVIVDCQINSPCGHSLAKIKCYLQKNGEGTDLMTACTKLCETILKCGHPCTGNCSECKQFRFHKACRSKCNAILVCNHECTIPCQQACRPCTKKCEISCVHNKCNKKCSEPCVKCSERCPRRCHHTRCTKRCGEICNVDPCTKRCDKKLKCGHQCVGFCSDPCPKLCRICHNDELTEIFLGSEDDPDAIYVMLIECGHIFEHNDLENWMKMYADQIKYKVCPKCKTNITRTHRYSNYIKKAIEDVIAVKLLSYDYENIDEINIITMDFDEIAAKLIGFYDVPKYWKDRVFTTNLHKLNKIEANEFSLKIKILQTLVDKEDLNLLGGNHTLRRKLVEQSIIDAVFSDFNLSEQLIEDIELELKRLNRIKQYEALKNNSDNLTDELELITNIETDLSTTSRFSIDRDNSLAENLRKLSEIFESKILFTEPERVEIVKAIGMKKGHWYKCPNGHPYVIGECGGANQISKCVCGAAIGGTDHHLLSTNAHAGEMDGFERHAWPGGLH